VAAPILFLPAAESLRFAGAGLVVFATTVGCDPFRILAQRAFCASAILRREAADTARFGFAYGLPPPNLATTERAASTCRSSSTTFVFLAFNSDTKDVSPFTFSIDCPLRHFDSG
jgi:hypothetical protein